MKTTEYKSINFIIGYTLGKIQQFWLSMQSNNYVHDGGVVTIPKSWLLQDEDLDKNLFIILNMVPRLFNEIISNCCFTAQIKESDCCYELHYVISKLPDVKKMTVADIEKELGYKIEIISE